MVDIPKRKSTQALRLHEKYCIFYKDSTKFYMAYLSTSLILKRSYDFEVL